MRDERSPLIEADEAPAAQDVAAPTEGATDFVTAKSAGAAPRARRKRRSRTSHPGVKLVEVLHRSGLSSWVARWRDPDEGKGVQLSLDKLGLTTHEARRAWAVTKSRTLTERTAALASGAPRHSGKKLSDAFDWYFKNPGARLRERTRELYKADTAPFLTWAESRRLRLADELSQAHLVQWVAWFAAQPRANANDTRGSTRSAQTVNKAARSLKAVLNALRRAGMVPHLSRDSITDGLTLLRTSRPLLEHLAPTEVRQLLEAALRHDAKTFKATRAENAAGLAYARAKARAEGRDVGPLPPRYEPAAPLLAFLVLSGCRDNEARVLRWDQVDLDARDERGVEVGEIRLGASVADAEDVKTGVGRIVDLAVSPALRLLLVAMKLRAGDVKKRPYVFGGAEPFGRGRLDRTRQRLATFGAPAWGPQKLRRTCATALVNSSIFGSATVWRAAKQLGHSPQVLEKHYAGLMRVSRDARTLEAVLGIEEGMRALTANVSGGDRARGAARG